MKYKKSLVISSIILIGVIVVFSYCCSNLFVSQSVIGRNVSSADDFSHDMDDLADKKALSTKVKITNYSIATLSYPCMSLDKGSGIEYEIFSNTFENCIEIKPFQTVEKDVVFFVDKSLSDDELYSAVDNGCISLSYYVSGITKKEFYSYGK